MTGQIRTSPALGDWLLFAVLAAPHVLYAFVWLFPGRWRAVFRRSPLNTFAAFATALKVLQFSMVSLWWLADEWGVPHISKVPTTHLLLGVGLVGVGQVSFCLVMFSRCNQGKNDKPSVLQTLNVSMYNAIGKKGVYYGEKLGSKVPWCTSFPFSVVSHPQYVGSVLSIWGVFALVYAQGPATLWTVATYWTGLYFVTGLIEQFL